MVENNTIIVIGYIVLALIVGYNLHRMKSLIANILVEVKEFNKRIHHLSKKSRK